ncbi:MAG TPA: maleylpyruvate isomerase N-terminal domain-containing protein [Mycobacteriales bacterium]|nr:maleylpyruvate isomerase N-terminal domain-containing protein [Mycobacteriales bacterium]
MVSIPPRPDLWTLTGLVDNAAADAVRRVRRRSALWWRGASACPGWSRADTVKHLVDAFAIYEQALEVGAGPRPATYRTPPAPAREAVLADQLAVVARDLVTALRAATDEAPARHPHHAMTAADLAAVALAECLVHTHDVDPAPLPEEAAGAVLARLHPVAATGLAGDAATLGDLLLRVQRGPGEWDWEL